MANGQITIHQSHLPRHFFMGVPVGLAAGFRRCVAACEAHLEDLRIEHAPLRSLTRVEMRRGD
jgi:hypothetical protein